MFIEVKVILQDDERDSTHRIDPYVSSSLTEEEVIQYIKQAIKAFGSEPDNVKVRVTIQV